MRLPGEAEIVRIFRKRLGVRGEPDDAEALPAGASCWCVDTLSAGTDVPPGMGLRRAARKSVVSCASDLAAKGFAPASGLVSVSLPAGTTASDASALAGGLAGAAGELGFAFAGGDTGQGAELSITVCLAGAAAAAGRGRKGGGRGRKWPGRGGARAGDIVFATGSFGLTSAGLRVAMGRAKASGRFGRAASSALYSPHCRARFGAAAARMFTSSMDTSDGLAAALAGMSRGSGAPFAVGGVPLAPGLERFAAANGLDAVRLALEGGEEYEIVFTARPSDRRRIAAAAKRTATPVSEIGIVEEGGGGGPGARLEAGGGSLEISGGWEHLGGAGP